MKQVQTEIMADIRQIYGRNQAEKRQISGRYFIDILKKYGRDMAGLL